MNTSKVNGIKKAGFYVFACLVFVATGFFYLSSAKKPADNSVSQVPYYSSVPEETGIVFDVNGKRTFFNLDFEREQISVIFLGETEDTENGIYGYSADHTVKGDYELVIGIVDGVDGIILSDGTEKLNFTGVQVADMLSLNRNSDEAVRSVVTAVLEKIKKSGFNKSNLSFIIENGDTDIKMPDCYDWHEYIGNMCKNAIYVN